MGDKNLMEKMIKKILSFYTGKKVLSYEKDRNNEKWKFEQSFVENFIKKNSDINSIIDAPIGTNRFGEIIDNCSNITSFVGLDFSDDMLNFSKTKNNKKLNLKKKDLINEKCDDEADLVLIIRMLNLFETKTSLKIIDNLLPSAKKYCIASLRYDNEYSFIENKIHIQPIEEFKKKILSLGYNYEISNFIDKRKGNFCLVLMKKN